MTATLPLLQHYCERAGQPGLFAEPLNALTNLGFLVAAGLAARSLARAHPSGAADLWLLVASLFAIGIGSAAWHLAPSRPTEWLDIIPIWLFINLYLLAALRRLLGLPAIAVAGIWAAYFVSDLAVQAYAPSDLLNGSVMYLPAFAALALLALAVHRFDAAAGRALLQSLGILACALVARTADRALCDAWPGGTHFLWHLLNGWLLWRLLRLLIDHQPRPSRCCQ